MKLRFQSGIFLAAWLAVFRPCFTAPVWNRILVLVAGAVLAPGKRTVTQALRVMGLADDSGFRRYHEVLSRARQRVKQVIAPIGATLPGVFTPRSRAFWCCGRLRRRRSC